ncbi:hypothetical protein F9B85_09480 [Heliorestis acidaminivorans]|uniref:Metallo-beta-lactamase domain-containing protein n=1 Tax=Heliorestis acidaminivorans TaxID=553427 RepID=A0A6I0EWE6_9FIRM|nr:MBL fold metallo-hydrolase [Heliorestis acidaminivorans]KAB2952375.1 hypothetical protein F9B85_09480 [Heliorestis acidaminivorans]
MIGPIIGIILFILLAAVALFFILPKYRPTAAYLALNLGREFTDKVKKPPKLLTVPMGKDNEVTLGWVGHSTWLVEMLGTRLITDPIFSKRAVFPKRLVAPAVQPEQIDSLQFVLLSHAHFDHLDLASLKALPEEAVIVLPAGDEAVVQDLPHKKVALKANESYSFEDLNFKTFQTRHKGERAMGQSSKLTLAYLIQKGDYSIFYIGDSAYSRELVEEVREACPQGIDAVLVPIAAYKPQEFQDDHCSPEDGLQMALEMGARSILPMHHETFQLSLEPIDEPLRRFKKAAEDLEVTKLINPLPIGGTLTIEKSPAKKDISKTYH